MTCVILIAANDVTFRRRKEDGEDLWEKEIET